MQPTTKYITNDTDSPLFLGGRMIPPGEGRDIALLYLPADLQDAPAPAAVPDEPNLDEQLLVLLTMAGGVKAIVLQLPDLTHEALDRLAELEMEAVPPRKTLLGAVAAEQLRRADLGIDGAAAVAQLTDAQRLAESQAAFEAEMDATHATQLAQLSAAERAALAEPLTAGTADVTSPAA